MKDKAIIGRIEKIDLPEFGIFGIEAKIDTGAYNSAIHCSNMKEEITEKGAILIFTLLDPKHPAFDGKEFTAHKFLKRSVRSSMGHSQRRYQIITKAVVAGRELEIAMNLSDRTGMTKAVLIGRTAISGRFLVDISKKA